MQGATAAYNEMFGMQTFQSTLPMQGATCIEGFTFVITGISIHAHYAGSDSSALRIFS